MSQTDHHLPHAIEPELHLPAPRPLRYNRHCGLAISPWKAQWLLIIVASAALAKLTVSTGDDLALGIIGFVILVVTSQILIWKDPLLERKLVRSGVPAAGKITSKYRSRGLRGGVGYSVKYEFLTDSGERIEEDRVVNGPRYDSVHEGQTLTILYDRHHPRKNVIYKLAAYRVKPIS
jgi:hypothetical protein